MSATAVHPEGILHDLNELWAQLAADQSDAGGVLRACAMTLVAVAQDAGDAENARLTVGLLMKEHPSRAILLHEGSRDSLEARVFAECWKPFGRSQQICAEGIEITTGAGGYAEVARFLVPLRVPDLPVVLWCRGAAALGAGGLAPLFPLADKIIFDSQGVADPDGAVRALRRLHAYGYRVADLHWTRLSGWREALAHLFDNPALRAESVRAAIVGYGGDSITTCARYFDAWLRTSLPQARVSIKTEGGPPGLRSVTLATASGDLTLRRDGSSVEIEEGGRRHRAALPSIAEEALMHEELGIAGADPVFERVLAA